MRKVSVFLLFLFTPLGEVALAESSPPMPDCSQISEDKERLGCYDKIKPPKAAAPPTAAAVAPPAAPAKAVDVQDLYVTPERFKDQAIEVRGVRCMHAGKDDYRCGYSGVNITFFTHDVSPSSERETLERECGEVKKAFFSSKCIRTIKLVVSDITKDLVDGYQKRVAFTVQKIDVAAATKRR